MHKAPRHDYGGSHVGVYFFQIGQHSFGISEELRNRLFQPFSAGDERTGSGLGLAICQEIVLGLGGSITLHNRMDGQRIAGLDAVVNLPLASALTDKHG